VQFRKFLIISLRRTGGTLVQRLLDGHSECSVFPFEFWNTRRKAVYDSIGSRLFPWMPASMKLTHCGHPKYRRKKFVVAHGEAGWPQFHDDLLDCARAASSPAEFYDLTAELYFGGYHPGGLEKIVVNHCANLCLLTPRQLEAIFGETRTIITTRDPRAAFVSTVRKARIKAKSRGQASEPTTARADVEAFCSSWRNAMERYYLGDRGAIALRFEDLVSEPRKTVEDLAGAMGIGFEATLLEPTNVGRPIGANTSFSRRAGIDAAAATSWREHLKPEWQNLIEDRLGDTMSRLGYAID